MTVPKHYYLLVSLFFSVLGGFSANPDLEVIRNRFVDQLMKPDVDNTRITQLINTIRSDGTWAGINYEDVSRIGFKHRKHLENMVELCRAYKKRRSSFGGDRKLKQTIDAALNFWLANDFICENWWWNQIGTPNRMVSILLIMDDDLSEEQIAKMLPIAGRASMDASGARPSGDRIKIAGILAKILLFQRDEVRFNEVIRIIEGEIKFSIERGMQYDYSFHHRMDRVNNTLSYGNDYANAFAEWAANVAGTRYQFSEQSLRLLTDYYLDGICKMLIHSRFPDPGAKNRSITRRGALHVFSTATPEHLLKAGNYRKAELEEIISIRKGKANSGLSYSTFFWQSEYFSYQRPEHFTSVRMFSSRNHNMEEPYNGEGLMSHHLGDGSNFISRTGEEYRHIFPVFDWQKIPGTTVVQKPALPSEKQIRKQGLTGFVGAVTDGLYGAVAFDFKSPHDPLEAKKAWFFFDDEYVCLGAGIRSGAQFPVVTTLNQCLLHGDVVMMNGDQRSVVARGEWEADRVKWIYHDSIGYLFPKPVIVHLSNQPATGSWYRINRQADSSKEEISKEVFKLWIDHGKRPHDSTYQYVVVPAATEQQVADKSANCPVEILSNSPQIQAVSQSRLNIVQIVFYQSGEIQISDDLKVGSDSPGLVMIRTEGSAIKAVSVADPSRKLGKMHLYVSSKTEKKGDGFEAVWDEDKGLSEISVELPQDVYAGKSVTFELE